MNTEFSKYRIVDLSGRGAREALTTELGEQLFFDGLPASYLRDLVLSRLYPARCVVVESDYIDRDFDIAFARFFARAFRDYPRRTKRLHFFRHNIGHADFFNASLLQQNYLGFTIATPVRPATIGRTVLKPPARPDTLSYVPCAASFSVNLAGATLQATGAPFIQQDDRVAACATAALWTATQTMTRNFDGELGAGSTTHITELATRFTLGTSGRPFPHPGLNVEQMLWALKELGYAPVTYYPRDIDPAMGSPAHEEAREIICQYADSGIPPVLILQLAGYPALHAVVVVGHVYSAELDPQVPLQAGYFSASQWCPHFLFHDDQNGPYLRLSVEPSSGWSDGWPRVRIDLDEPFARPHAGRIRDLYPDRQAILRAVIVPLPPRVYLLAEEAAEKGQKLLQRMYEALRNRFRLPKVAQPVYRTYLISSNEYKNRLVPGVQGLSKGLMHMLRDRLLSRYMWVTEMADKSTTAGQHPNEPSVVAEALMETTSSPSLTDFLVLHWCGAFAFMEPKDEDIDEALQRAVAIKDDSPHQPIIRCLADP